MCKISINDLKNKRVHFVGVGGISMSGLAQMLNSFGVYVQGSNECENDETLRLKSLGLKIFLQHKKENLKNIDAVVYSSAISDDNEELVFARTNGLQVFKRAQLLGVLAEGYECVISVAGSHGKTTTAAMISDIFLNAKLDPTLHLGGVLKSIDSSVRIGGKRFFITESCEYKNNYLYLHPNLSVILNIDADHLDFFGDLQGVKESFFKFSKNTKRGGLNIVNSDDENINDIKKSAKSVTFGLKNANTLANNIKNDKNGYFAFDVIFEDFILGNVKLGLIGKHNIYNALAAIMVGVLCEIDFEIIKNSIENFAGTKRRCDYVCEKKGVRFYQDYAHHPKQIIEMIKSFKLLLKQNKKLFVVFEPHTFSRTKFLIDEFAIAFDDADYVLLAPVYSARENEGDGFSSEVLKREIQKRNKNVKLFDDYNQIKKDLFLTTNKGDVVLILGAGSIEKLAMMIKEN